MEEAFQNQKGAIENLLAKLLEKKNYVHFAATQVQNRYVVFPGNHNFTLWIIKHIGSSLNLFSFYVILSIN